MAWTVTSWVISWCLLYERRAAKAYLLRLWSEYISFSVSYNQGAKRAERDPHYRHVRLNSMAQNDWMAVSKDSARVTKGDSDFGALRGCTH